MSTFKSPWGKSPEDSNAWFSTILQSIGDAVIATDAQGDVVFMNPVAESLTGWKQEEALGKPLAEVFRIVNDQTHEPVEDPVTKVIRAGTVVGLANHTLLITKNGTEIAIDDSGAPIRDDKGNVMGVVLVFHDVTKRRRTERRLAAERDVTRILAESESLAQATPGILQAVCESLGWVLGELWQVDRYAHVLRCVEIWHAPSIEVADFKTQTLRLVLSRGAGLAGHVWAAEKPVWITDMTEAHAFPRALVAGKEGLRAAFGSTIRAGSDILGVMNFFSRAIQPPDEDLLQMMAGIGSQIGQFIERKEAEDAVRESEERYRTVAEAASDAIITIDEESTIRFANRTVEEIFGYTTDELLGQKLTQLMPESMRAAHRAAVQRYIQTGRKHITWKSMTLPGLHKSGKEIPLEISFGEFAKGGQRFFTGIIRDITERKRAEEALRESEAKFRAVAETAACAMFIYQGTRFRYVNPGTEAITGYTREELLTINFWDVIHPDSRDLIRERGLARQRGEPVPSRYESKIVTKAGEVRWIELTAGLIHFEGQPAVMGTAYDITERKRAEQTRAQLLAREQAIRSEAEAAERRSAFLAEASKVLASSLDYQTTLTGIARLAVPPIADWCVVDMLESDGSLRRLAVAHVDPAKVELSRELDRRYPTRPDAPFGPAHVVRTGQSEIYSDIPDSMLEAVAEDAEHLKLLRELGLKSYMAVALTTRERTLGAITFVTAESDRRYGPSDLLLAEDLARRASIAIDNARLYGEAQEANRTKDQFLAILSHELRTPLTPIVGWVRLLRSEKLDQTTTARALETIERNARTQARLVEDLLDVSRIITGKLRLELRPIELAPIIEVAIDAVQSAAEAKSIRIDKIFDRSVGPILGDANRIQQILWNLLSNATKFTPRNGCIEVRLERAGSQVEIKVKDTGMGISADFLPYVFERFRQADSSITRSHGGLGLGLALVRHLVELHGGTVYAESPGEGKGATFTVRLPMRAVRMEAEPATPVEPESRLSDAVPSLEGLRVLVVDDEADTRDLLSTVLARYGAKVIAAGSVGEAIEVFTNVKPDVLVSDLGMPDEDGYDLIHRVRELGQVGQIPAIALTAYARTEDRLRVLSAGFQMHVPKPVNPAELVTVIASVVDGRTGPSTPLSS